MASFHCGRQLLSVEIDASPRTFHGNGNDTKYYERPSASIKLRLPSPQNVAFPLAFGGQRGRAILSRLLGGAALRHWALAHNRPRFLGQLPWMPGGKTLSFSPDSGDQARAWHLSESSEQWTLEETPAVPLEGRHRLVRPCRSSTRRRRRKKSRTFQLHFVLLRLRLRFAIREHPKIS